MVQNIPANGGPTNEAAPRNKHNRPNALVNFSKPSISTRITEVKHTYAAKEQQQKMINPLKSRMTI